MKLTNEDLRELIPSGGETYFRNRVSWAKTYLKKAGLIDSPRRAIYIINENGLELLASKPEFISKKLLGKYKGFREFQATKNTKVSKNVLKPNLSEEKSDLTPEELLESAYQNLHAELSLELLDIVKTCSPEFFERLIIDLLITMGYGGSRKEAGQAMGRAGDGGIDGIINEDKLGLDVIYLQAKRWENSVPVKEIRDFTGALASKKAKKGVFITTSSFPKSVYEFVSQVEYKIILIDGNRLADLMIEYGIGLSTVNSYYIKTIDTDYFEE
jgi:restriction system protein